MYEFKDDSGNVFKVLNKRVMVEMDVVAEKTESGIIPREYFGAQINQFGLIQS